MDEDTVEQAENSHDVLEQEKTRASHLQPWQYKKGQSGNPKGRTAGTVSLKEYAKEMLGKMTDEERQTFMEGLPKETIWKMAEGNHANNTDITTNGKDMPVPIMSFDVHKNNSNTTDSKSTE